MAAPNHLAAKLMITLLASLVGPGCDKQTPATENPGADAPAGDEAGEEPASEEPTEDMSAPGHDMDAMGGEEEEAEEGE